MSVWKQNMVENIVFGKEEETATIFTSLFKINRKPSNLKHS